MHNVQVTPIIGLPQLDGWSHVTQNQSNSLIWNVSLHGNHARNVGRDLLDLITNIEPRNASEFYKIFQQIIAEAQEKECLLSCAAVFFENNLITFATFNAQVLLKRDSKVGTLLNGLDTTKVIQGKSKASDVIILATARAVTFLDEVKMKIKQGYDIDTVVASLTPSLQLQDNSSLTAMAFIQINGEAQPDSNDQSQSDLIDQKQHSDFPEPQSQSDLIDQKQHSDFESDSFSSKNDATNLDIGKNIQDFHSKNERTQYDQEPGPKRVGSVKSDTQLTILGIFQNFSTLAQKFKKLVLVFFAKTKVFSSFVLSYGTKNTKITASFIKKNAPTYLAKVKDLTKKVAVIVKTIISKITKKEVYIVSTPSRKVTRLLIGTFLIVVLTASILGWWYWQRTQNKQEVLTDLISIEQEFERITPNIDRAPIESRDKLLSVLDQINSLKQVYQNSENFLAQIQEVETKVMSAYQEVSRREELQELQVFVDLSQTEANFIGSDLTVQRNQLFVLDGDAKKIIKISLDDKKTQLYSLSRNSQNNDESTDNSSSSEANVESAASKLVSFAVAPDNSVAYGLGDGVFEFNLENNDAELLVESGIRLTEAKILRFYENNVYIFNPERQNIFRFDANESNPELSGWVKSSQGLQYQQVVSMAIDGDIWLGNRNGNIVRMRSGQPQTYAISAIEKPFESEIIIYTQEGFDHIYVLEPKLNRIVQLSKRGEFTKEFVSSTLASANSMVVNSEESKILILSGSLIYQLEI
jgi:hypothetical protein